MECAYYYVDGTWNVPTTLTYVGDVNNGTALHRVKLLRMRMMSGTSWF
jgi:hypothetical protein